MLQWLAASEGQRRLLYFPFELKVGPVPLAEAWSMGAVCMTQERMHVQEWMLLQYNHPIYSHTFPIHPHTIFIKSYPIASYCSVSVWHAMFQQGVGALESRPVSPGGHGGSAVWCFDERAEAKKGQWHLRAFEAWSLMGWACFFPRATWNFKLIIRDARNMCWWSLSVWMLAYGIRYLAWNSQDSMFWEWLGMGHDVPWWNSDFPRHNWCIPIQGGRSWWWPDGPQDS